MDLVSLYICPAFLSVVTLLIIIIVFIPLDLILYNLGAVGSQSSLIVPKGEAFYEVPVAEDFGWGAGDLADQLVD